MQTYLSGEEVNLGDIVSRNSEDEGVIVALQNRLAEWGLSDAESKGMVMIKWKKMGLICESTAYNEDSSSFAEPHPEASAKKKSRAPPTWCKFPP